MRSYETTFILAPTLDAEGVAREIDSVKTVITAQGGEVTAEKEWGRRRLAYPIRDHSEGVYHILRFTLDEPRGLKELARHFRLNESVLRHLVIRDEGTSLEDVGKVSESEEHNEHRDHRHGPRRSFAPSRGGEPTADSRPRREGGDEAEGDSKGAPVAAGGEETRG